MTTLIQRVEFGSQTSDLLNRMRFRMNAGEKKRIAFLEDALVRAEVHYRRSYFFCLGPECPACNFEDPKVRYGAHIFVYNLVDEYEPADPVSGQIKFWTFGTDKYPNLSGIASTVGKDLRKVDIGLECIEQTYQRFSIVSLNDLIWVQEPTSAQRVQTLYTEKKLAENYILDMLGRQKTPQQIANAYAQPLDDEPPDTADSPVAAVPTNFPVPTEQLQSILQQLSTAPPGSNVAPKPAGQS